MIRRLLIYTLLFFLLIYGLRAWLYAGLKANPAGIYRKYDALFLESQQYTTLLLGSSRMESHVVTPLFDSLTNSNSYNAGIQGATTRVAYLTLRAYCLNSVVPKTVIFELDPHVARYPTDTIFHFPRLFPYLSNPVLYKGCAALDGRFWAFRYLAPYSLSYMGPGYLQASFNGWMGRQGAYDSLYRQGHTPFRLRPKPRAASAYYDYIHPETRAYLDSLMGFCKERQIRLLFLISPMHRHCQEEIKNLPEVVRHYKLIANIHRISLLDYSNDPIGTQGDWFADDYHLLEPGAREFTRQFSLDFNNISP